mmetsp:Transcript_14272/g.36107  ORF Transcript_14272/g.36107 Transcript_14272/m.36107 type:complete len:1323 (-) Transcript_14272:83-4051(-)
MSRFGGSGGTPSAASAYLASQASSRAADRLVNRCPHGEQAVVAPPGEWQGLQNKHEGWVCCTCYKHLEDSDAFQLHFAEHVRTDMALPADERGDLMHMVGFGSEDGCFPDFWCFHCKSGDLSMSRKLKICYAMITERNPVERGRLADIMRSTARFVASDFRDFTELPKPLQSVFGSQRQVNLQTLAKLWSESIAGERRGDSSIGTRIVVMAGAGISVSAGIPDFRSAKTGLYANLGKYKLGRPEDMFTLNFFKASKGGAFYTFASELWPTGEIAPTPTHYFFRLLHEKGLLARLYTQNIDGLERLAGVPSELIVEAHGTFETARCVHCGQNHDSNAVRDRILCQQVPIMCELCNNAEGFVKPDIVFFGERTPEKFHSRPGDFEKCDLLLVLGTSLKVTPFNTLPGTVRVVTPRVLVNREKVFGRGDYPLDFDSRVHYRDVFVEGDCDTGVEAIVNALGWQDDWKRIMDARNAEYGPEGTKRMAAVERQKELQAKVAAAKAAQGNVEAPSTALPSDNAQPSPPSIARSNTGRKLPAVIAATRSKESPGPAVPQSSTTRKPREVAPEDTTNAPTPQRTPRLRAPWTPDCTSESPFNTGWRLLQGEWKNTYGAQIQVKEDKSVVLNGRPSKHLVVDGTKVTWMGAWSLDLSNVTQAKAEWSNGNGQVVAWVRPQQSTNAVEPVKAFDVDKLVLTVGDDIVLWPVPEEDAEQLLACFESDANRIGMFINVGFSAEHDSVSHAVRQWRTKISSGLGLYLGIYCSGVLCGHVRMDLLHGNPVSISLEYWIHKDYGGRGVVSRSVMVAVKYALKEHVWKQAPDHVLIVCHPNNNPSRVIAWRLGAHPVDIANAKEKESSQLYRKRYILPAGEHDGLSLDERMRFGSLMSSARARKKRFATKVLPHFGPAIAEYLHLIANITCSALRIRKLELLGPVIVDCSVPDECRIVFHALTHVVCLTGEGVVAIVGPAVSGNFVFRPDPKDPIEWIWRLHGCSGSLVERDGPLWAPKSPRRLCFSLNSETGHTLLQEAAQVWRIPEIGADTGSLSVQCQSYEPLGNVFPLPPGCSRHPGPEWRMVAACRGQAVAVFCRLVRGVFSNGLWVSVTPPSASATDLNALAGGVLGAVRWVKRDLSVGDAHKVKTLWLVNEDDRGRLPTLLGFSLYHPVPRHFRRDYAKIHGERHAISLRGDVRAARQALYVKDLFPHWERVVEWRILSAQATDKVGTGTFEEQTPNGQIPTGSYESLAPDARATVARAVSSAWTLGATDQVFAEPRAASLDTDRSKRVPGAFHRCRSHERAGPMSQWWRTSTAMMTHPSAPPLLQRRRAK